MSVLVVVGPRVSPVSVDFPEGLERSRKGSISVRPNSTTTVTQDEVDYLKKHHRKLWNECRVVEKKKAAPPAPKAPDVSPVVAVPRERKAVKSDEPGEHEATFDLSEDDFE